MISLVSRLWRKIRTSLGYPKPFRTQIREEIPDSCEFETIYLIGEDGNYWFAAMQCPCGCGAKIQLSLLSDDKPSWTATVHRDETVSLHPSVWRKVGCKSHYWFKRGLVRWC